MTFAGSRVLRIAGVSLMQLYIASTCAHALPEENLQTRPALMEDRAAGLSEHGGVSRGVAWADFTGDGYPDLAVANTEAGTLFLYRNLNGESFERVESGDIWNFAADAQGVAWTDVNNDGWFDLFVTIENGRNRLLLNDGKGGLHDVDAGALTQDVTQSTQSCWADVNRDGWLDVYVVNADYQPDRLYLNLGDNQFGPLAGPWDLHQNHGRSCAFADPNNDGYADLYVTNAYSEESGTRRVTSNTFYQNSETGFEEILSGEFVNFKGYSYGTSWFDIDQDGDEDLLVSNISRYEPNWMFENVGGAHFFPNWGSQIMRHRPGPAKGHVWADFDNDGDTDLFLAEGHGGARPEHAPFDNRNSYYENRNGELSPMEVPTLTTDERISAGAAAADIDLDGDLDLMIANWAGDNLNNEFYRNTSKGDWVTIRLVGTQSNRLGIGARVSLQVHGVDQTPQFKSLWLNSGYASMSQPVLHFGLGEAMRIDHLSIKWPSGRVDTYNDIDPNTHYIATEDTGLESVQN